VPFGPIKAGSKRIAVIEIRGPRERPEQRAFKAALKQLLKKNNSRIKPRRPGG